jgi:hypothetical protein
MQDKNENILSSKDKIQGLSGKQNLLLRHIAGGS